MKPKKPKRLWLGRSEIHRGEWYVYEANGPVGTLDDTAVSNLGLPNDLKFGTSIQIELGPDGKWRRVK